MKKFYVHQIATQRPQTITHGTIYTLSMYLQALVTVTDQRNMSGEGLDWFLSAVHDYHYLHCVLLHT